MHVFHITELLFPPWSAKYFFFVEYIIHLFLTFKTLQKSLQNPHT